MESKTYIIMFKGKEKRCKSVERYNRISYNIEVKMESNSSKSPSCQKMIVRWIKIKICEPTKVGEFQENHILKIVFYFIFKNPYIIPRQGGSQTSPLSLNLPAISFLKKNWEEGEPLIQLKSPSLNWRATTSLENDETWETLSTIREEDPLVSCIPSLSCKPYI